MSDVNVQPHGLQMELYRLSSASRRWVLGVSAQLAEKDAENKRLKAELVAAEIKCEECWTRKADQIVAAVKNFKRREIR